MLTHPTALEEHHEEGVSSLFSCDTEKRMSMYFLDLETVIEHLHGANALVSTLFPDGIPPHPSPCRGYIRLKEGHIDEYWIEGQNGFRLQSPLAAQYLRQRNEWTVELEREDHVSALPVEERSDERHPAPSSFVHVHTFDECIFSQQRSLAPHLLDSLSHKERMVVRMVHLMMNGQRSIDHIRQTLHLSSSVIEIAVRTLQRVQAIQEIHKD